MIANNSGRYRCKDDSRIFGLVREHDERGLCASGAVGVEMAHVAQSGAGKHVKRSSEITAQKVGTSARNVERIRTIIDRGDDSLIGLVEAGQLSIHAAYRRIIDIGSPQKPLTIAELFLQIMSMQGSKDRRPPVLGQAEVTLIRLLVEEFRAQGYLTKNEFSMVMKRICTLLGFPFGGGF